jgi:hypothetical protein
MATKINRDKKFDLPPKGERNPDPITSAPFRFGARGTSRK